MTLGMLAALSLVGCTESDPPDTARSTAPQTAESALESGSAAELAERVAAGFNSGSWDGLPWAEVDGRRSTEAAALAQGWLDIVHELKWFAGQMQLLEVEQLPQGDVPISPEISGEIAETSALARFTLTWRAHANGVDFGDDGVSKSVATSARLVQNAAAASDQDGDWLVIWSTALVAGEPVDPESTLVETRDQAPRGRILAQDGTALVEDLPVVRIGVHKPFVPADQDAAGVARELAAVLEIDPDEYVRRVEAAGPQAFVPALTLRQGQAPAYDLSAFGEEVLSQPGTQPLAPTREFASALLGVAGEATAEAIEESDGAIQPGDTVGLSGLQRTLDQVLRGSPAVRLGIDQPDDLTDLEGIAAASWQAGQDVVLTLDAAVQQAADNALAPVAGAQAALVAIRPSTGAVVAVANSLGTEGVNLAMEGQYPPGSVFKVVSALAMLRQGMAPTSPVECPVAATVDGHEFGNYDGYPASRLGRITLGKAFTFSCNTAFIEAAGAVSQTDLIAAAEDLGVGVPLTTGVTAYAGSLPDQAGATEHAAEMIGQGEVLVTPLVMAAVAASVAAGGRVTPSLVVDPFPVGSDYAAAPSALSQDEAQVLRSMMRRVVTAGTGQVLAAAPGEPGAKTGTAEYGQEVPPRTHAWMIAFDAEADIAAAVLVADGGTGSDSAGPVLASFLTLAADLPAGPPPTDPDQ
jgi:cell division protein FtsI/penicillin-binding protein 2